MRSMVPYVTCCHGFIRSTSVGGRLDPPSLVGEVRDVLGNQFLGNWYCSLRNGHAVKEKEKSKLKIAQYPSLRARSETLLQAKVTACQVGSKPRMGCLWGCRWADGIVPTGTLVLCHWLLHFSPGGRPGIFGIDLPLPAVRMPRSSHDSWAGRCCLPPGWIDSRLPHTARLFGHAFFAGGRWERGCVAAE